MTITSDERAQLVEDIQRTVNFPFHIVKQAKADRAFDIKAASEELDELDKSISARVTEGWSRVGEIMR